MRLTVKILKGKECVITVNPETTVLEMKQQISQILDIPVVHQKIVHLGRSLVDENTISTYPTIKDGTKLNLAVKKPDPLKEVIYRSFRKYYNDEHSEKLTKEFMKDFEAKLRQLSLDDIEKLAENMLAYSM
ncbi:ubiquitin-like protein 4A [Eupeodes corollae]|uniref:ubiquitin-like protein 4A n=1 Tax=Eupeodes corollae TaxID=290404 RepID=UPI0024928102|nr:ubiquitin-like protein 4A [Eupeodes corollae]